MSVAPRDRVAASRLSGLPRTTLLSLFAVASMAADDSIAASDYWPATNGPWQTVAAADAGFDEASLEGALDYAMESKSSAIVVTSDGRLVAERYARIEGGERYERMLTGFNDRGRPIEDVASVQKSVISLLVGIGLEAGELSLETPVSQYLGEGWSKASVEQETKIQILHLLSMTSGLKPSLEFEAPAGTLWRYNTRAYAQLVPVLEKSSSRSLQDLTRERISAKLGLEDSSWTEREWLQASIDANRLGFSSTARDLARIGVLALRGGQWSQERIVSEAWVKRSTSPSQDLNPAYGLLWWLAGQSGHGAGGQESGASRFDNAPDDLFAAIGALGRRIYVIPSQGLVVTRLGANPGRDFDEEFVARLMAARHQP